MAIRRSIALKRLRGLVVRVEEHLAKLAQDPSSWDEGHWAEEIQNWLDQMTDVLHVLGRKTSAEWQARIEELRSRLGNNYGKQQ